MRQPTMNEGLVQHKPELLDGEEPFHGPGAEQSLQLLDYWRWSGLTCRRRMLPAKTESFIIHPTVRSRGGILISKAYIGTEKLI